MKPIAAVVRVTPEEWDYLRNGGFIGIRFSVVNDVANPVVESEGVSASNIPEEEVPPPPVPTKPSKVKAEKEKKETHGKIPTLSIKLGKK